MLCGIYARKSGDDSDKNEEARSTTRQIERATAYVQSTGWTVDLRYVYVDDTVSGAEWKHRPGWNALIAALEPRPPFGVVVVSELSRIGRDTVRTPAAVMQLEEAGVEVRSYATDSRFARTRSTRRSWIAATKGALDTLVKHWSAILGPRGVRVNAVAPGVIQTDMSNFTKTEAGHELQ